MFNKKVSAIIIAAVIAIVVGGSVSALEKVSPNEAILKFFAMRGVEAKTLTVSTDLMTREEWNKLNTILHSEDDPDSDTDDHDILNALVWDALNSAGASVESPKYLQLGDTQWILGLADEE